MSEDTLKEEPVESLEDAIAATIDATDEPEKEAEEDTTEDSGETEEETEESDDEPEETEEETEDDSEDDEPEDESGDDEPEDSLEPPVHWSAEDKATFSNVPRAAQEFILERHKAMEGDYTRKTQEIAPIRRQFEAIQDALAPYEQEFARSGLDHAGAVRQLAHWHQALKTEPRLAIQQLAQTYGVDLGADLDEDETTDPAMQSVLQKLNALEKGLANQTQTAQQSEYARIESEIQAFKTAKGENGELLRPHFDALHDDMAALMSGGLVERGNLSEAYEKAMKLHPELEPPKPKPAVKDNQAEKVKRAKRAAKSITNGSGAASEKKRAMTLEEEIASLMP